MAGLAEEAEALAAQATSAIDASVESRLDQVADAARATGDSWSGSPLGYHANLYFRGFETPPANAAFNREWGLYHSFISTPHPGWERRTDAEVRTHVLALAGEPALAPLEAASAEAADVLSEVKSGLESILTAAIQGGSDSYLEDRLKAVGDVRVPSEAEAAEMIRPKGNFMTRDPSWDGTLKTAPHHVVLIEAAKANASFKGLEALARLGRQIASHLRRREAVVGLAAPPPGPGKVFVGHGRSAEWLKLSDFLSRRLSLQVDEYNRVATAGITTSTRLETMADEASFALLVLTGEDELANGSSVARMNVVHEVGLFQGRLGLRRAIVLLEEGCEEFSNIVGLGQIRFPKNNIRAAFEEIREVLEREGLL